MSASITFSAIRTSAKNTNVKVDENGYYFVTLGAFNVFNGAGDFYLDEGAKDLIENKSHLLARRLANGYLKGEAGHPQWAPGMTKAQFYARNLKIDLANSSHHIKDITLRETGEKSGVNGTGKVVVVEAWVKPTDNDLGRQLKADLDDPEINVAFSIRSFTKDQKISGINFKKLLNIITWDWVLEPGIKRANKWDTVATTVSAESMVEFTMDVDELKAEINTNQVVQVSLESADEAAVNAEILDSVNNSSVAYLESW